MSLVLGYWNIRGRADCLRLILAYGGEEYEEKIYSIHNLSEWFDHKYEVGLDFPNIPYLIDGEKRLSQNLAILRYLGRKYGLDGKTEDEIIRLDMTEQVVEEIFMVLIRAWLEKEHYEESVDNLMKNLPDKLGQLGKFLGDGSFILGDRVSYVDFFMYSILDYIRMFKPELVGKEPPLEAFLARFEALPVMEVHMKSDKFFRMPITGPMFNWGSEDSSSYATACV